MSSRDKPDALAVLHIGQQPTQFLFDHGVALARAHLQPDPVQHGNVAAAVANQTGVLQLPGGKILVGFRPEEYAASVK